MQAVMMRQGQTGQGTTGIVIVGLGKTGLSCARYFHRQGIRVTVMDSREDPPGLDALKAELPDVQLVLGRFDTDVLVHAEQIVISPGVAVREPPIMAAIDRGVPVVGDIELFARQAKAPVIAITGSNGKSTVTTLVGEMARRAGRDVRVGGNLGTPALELLGEQEPDLYVLELSSFQLETTYSLNARAAVVLNVSQDHLDRYRDMHEYAEAKHRIYQGNGLMVLNADEPRVLAWTEPNRRSVRFGLGEPQADTDYGVRRVGGEAYLARGTQLLMRVSEMRIVGWHNVANALAALALGEAAELPLAAMLQALREFRGLPHRCQWIAEADGVAWYDDSKATNVGAAVAAINGMENKVVLIAGGLGKGQDFAPLKPVLADKGRAVILIGRDAAQIDVALEGVVPVYYAANFGEVVAQAQRLAQPGDVVLLAPACASFDMFSGYEERGRVFAEAVQRLLQ